MLLLLCANQNALLYNVIHFSVQILIKNNVFPKAQVPEIIAVQLKIQTVCALSLLTSKCSWAQLKNYSIQIRDLFLFMYIFIFCGKNRSSFSIFLDISGRYIHSTSSCNFMFRNATRLPSGMITGTCASRYSSTYKYWLGGGGGVKH